MQKHYDTKSALLSPRKLMHKIFLFFLAVSGLVFSSTLLANQTENQQRDPGARVTYLNIDRGNHSGADKIDDDDEIGSTYFMIINADIGVYNRENNSKQGE